MEKLLYIACSIWNSIRVYMGIVTVYTFFFWCSLRKFSLCFFLWSHGNRYCIQMSLHMFTLEQISSVVHTGTVTVYTCTCFCRCSLCNSFSICFFWCPREQYLYKQVSFCFLRKVTVYTCVFLCHM